jgi:hypothetical protein
MPLTAPASAERRRLIHVRQTWGSGRKGKEEGSAIPW